MENRISENLVILRERYNIGKKQMADLIGVSRQALHLYETGKANPSLDTLIFMTQIFDCSLDYLVFSNLEKECVTHDMLQSEDMTRIKIYTMLSDAEHISEQLKIQRTNLSKSITDIEKNIVELREMLGKKEK